MIPLEQCVSRIERQEQILGHRLGWRFLMGPRRTFSGKTRVAFITMNPGGAADDPTYPRASVEAGSAYWTEAWPGREVGADPLQWQVQALFKMVAELTGAKSAQAYVDREVLSAYFVPFRSPNVNTLHRRAESMVFARQLWSAIFAEGVPQVILTLGRDAYDGLHEVLTGLGWTAFAHRPYDVGWGRQTAVVERFRHGPGAVVLARMPHLSRFKLFSGDEARRTKIRAFLRDVFGELAHRA